MHEDYRHYREKGTCLQMKRLASLRQQVKQTSQMIDRFNAEMRLEERKFDKLKAPMTFAASSILCSFPANASQLEHLSAFDFLLQYSKPSTNRQHVVWKLIRSNQRHSVIDIDHAKYIVSEYFNGYKTERDIDELFRFLDIHDIDSLSLQGIVVLCCYAERYFLHQLARMQTMKFERPLQEMIDFEFLKRKLNGLVLTDSLRRLLDTLDNVQ
jgi:hypothetical protein